MRSGPAFPPAQEGASDEAGAAICITSLVRVTGKGSKENRTPTCRMWHAVLTPVHFTALCCVQKSHRPGNWLSSLPEGDSRAQDGRHGSC